MRITESKLRSIIRQVIAESSTNIRLDNWLRDTMVDDCSKLLGDSCEYIPENPSFAKGLTGIKKSNGMCFLTVDSNRVNIIEDALSNSEIEKLVKFLRNCNILKNDKICSGVFMKGKKIDLGDYEA